MNPYTLKFPDIKNLPHSFLEFLSEHQSVRYNLQVKILLRKGAVPVNLKDPSRMISSLSNQKKAFTSVKFLLFFETLQPARLIGLTKLLESYYFGKHTTWEIITWNVVHGKIPNLEKSCWWVKPIFYELIFRIKILNRNCFGLYSLQSYKNIQLNITFTISWGKLLNALFEERCVSL